jgi:hypothetical protein
MNIQKNHIGTGNYFFRQVAQRMNAQFSHGTLTEFDFKTITVFPLLHISLSRVDVGQSLTTLTYTIMIADQNSRITNDFQGLSLEDVYKEYGYSENFNYAYVLQEMYIRIVKEMTYVEQQMFNNLQINRPFAMTPFMQDLDSVLTGYTIDVSLDVLNPIVTDGWC